MLEGMSLLLLYILVTLPALGGRALAVRVLGFDDAGGWALGRTLGLVLAAFAAWWAGVAGLVEWLWVGTVLLVCLAVWGAVDLWRNRPDWRSLATTELVFVICAAAVVWLRLARPEILNQEKLMDLGIFASLMRAEGFPPPDMWLAGETLPYYYWGAVVWTVPLVLSRIPLDLSYNLVVAAVGGLTGVLLWWLGQRSGEGRWSGWLAVFFGLFAGTADGVRQLVAGRPITGLDYWHSSRQVPDTITEWPLFTLWLGDLHPHLLSMPLALGAMALAWHAGRRGPRLPVVITTTVLFGLTWAANPWAMPPTLVAVALVMVCGDGRWHWPTREGWPRWAGVAVVAVGGWLAAAPFHLSFHPPFQGIAAVRAWTDPVQLALWGGVLLVPAGAAGWVLLTRIMGGDRKARAVAVTVVAASLVLASLTKRPTLIMLVMLLAIFIVAAITGPGRSWRPGIALAALAVFLLAVPEVVHVVDTYGDKLHRMNTVFKCYIQAWLLLAIALPALVEIGFRRPRFRVMAIGIVGVLALPHLVGMALPPIAGQPVGLDGLSWMDTGDRELVRHLRTQPRGVSLVEAVGGAYTEYARISSASGVPSVLGWANHELVWRGHEAVGNETNRRRQLIETIYRSADPAAVADAVAETGADFVVIGALETRDFNPDQLDAIRRAGKVEFEADGGELVRFTAETRNLAAGESAAVD
jgi:YYY domain-containing protein